MPDLKGQRIVLTRSAEDCALWAEALKARGADPIALPCIRSRHIDSPELRAALAAQVDHAGWLVFTSQQGVAAFAQLRPGPLPTGLRIAAVGDTTAQAARELVGRVALISRGTGAQLGDDLGDIVRKVSRTAQSVRILLALAANARSVLQDKLEAAGAVCTRLDIYRTEPAEPDTPKLALSSLRSDAVWLASPTAVTGFCNRVELDAAARYFSIGPTTSAAIEAAGLAVAAQARVPSLEGLLEAMQ
jgi:uroporphyrinogen-III synthase